MLLCTTGMERSTSNGILSIFKTGLQNQQRDNSTKTSVSTLIEPSSLSQPYQREDTLTTSNKKWSLRPRMVEDHKNSTSISHQEPSETDHTTHHSISKAQVKRTTCRRTLPAQDGGRCSSTMVLISLTSRTKRLWVFKVEKMLKLQTSE